MKRIDELTMNSIGFAILCNFPQFCGMERAKEASEQFRAMKDELLAYRAAMPFENLPAANVTLVVHGQWKYNTDDFTPAKRCSICGYNKPVIAGEGIKQEPENYCPNCGAKMQEGR